MSIKSIIKNELVKDEYSVWVLKEHKDFGYSDGVETERYLESVFKIATDLRSDSTELESYIKDWPSEYHLTTKRAQLFSGFDFDRSSSVLEVGGGCGAITRYLGENFSEVISIEGSIHRARLARLRTKDLPEVSILCAPFQDIKFSKKFDMIFCIGVYEYSSSFVDGDDPYDTVLKYFSEMLNPGGVCIIAIENQFGLKYFNSSREDHTNLKYEGLEGYHVHGEEVKTFGRYELERNLRKHFENTQFYYPYPDYKLPDCIITEEFLKNKLSGELVSQMNSRDYYGKLPSSWDESLVTQELSRNEVLPFFSNSFLAFAYKNGASAVKFEQLAIISSSNRRDKFKTRTRIYQDNRRNLVVSKKLRTGEKAIREGQLTFVETSSLWNDFDSLNTVIYKRCKSKSLSVSEIFMPSIAWREYLDGESKVKDNNEKYLPGKLLDCTWWNFYKNLDNVSIIDEEWLWGEDIKFNTVVIRSVYYFLCKFENIDYLIELLNTRSFMNMIIQISKSIGVKLDKEDFDDFIAFESNLKMIVYNTDTKDATIQLKKQLSDGNGAYYAKIIFKFSKKMYVFLRHRLANLYRFIFPLKRN